MDLTKISPTSIPGLIYHPECFTVSEEDTFINELDALSWTTLSCRRVQYHGYRYDVRARSSKELFLGPLLSWLQSIAVSLHHKGYFTIIPDAVLVNEYLPEQGLGPHVDDTWSFSDAIAVLSIGAGIQVDFTHPSQQSVQFYAERRSFYVMTKESRYEWSHGIGARLVDVVDGQDIPRSRRISITFRKLIY